jgi:ABC-type bacteriocin/lantibiotic exporter with double-glycine peptidase domain
MMLSVMIMKKITINYSKQPTGNSCGPACIFMVSNGKKSITEIADDCGTDWIVGTPPERMIRGFESCNIDYIEYINSTSPFLDLITSINDDKIPILRTITRGIPHWIIVNGYDEEKFYILDPWLGEITYSPEQLDEIWKPRRYQFFEINYEN